MKNLSHDIFLLMINLSQLKSRDKVISIFCEAINSYSDQFQISFSEILIEGKDRRIEIRTRMNEFGYIYYEGEFSSVDEGFMDVFHNSVQMLALLLEKILQDKLLLDEKMMLKDLVNKKTKELQASEERWKMIFRDIPNLSVQGYDENGKLFYWNKASELMYGYTEQEVLGKDLCDLIIPDEMKEGVSEAMKNMFQAKIPIPAGELQLKQKDGSQVSVFSSHSYIEIPGRKPEMYCLDIDISELKNAEKKLFESREWFETTLRSIGDAVITTDTNGKVTLMNHVAENMTGWSVEDAVGEPIEKVFNIVNETTRQPVEIPVDKVLKNKSIVGLANHTIIISKNGEEYPIDDSAAPICSSDGVILGVVLIFKNITERKKTEIALKQSEQTYRSTVDGLLVGVVVHDSDTKILLNNKEASDILGLTVEQMEGKEAIDPEWQFVYEDLTPMKLEDYPINKVISTKQPLTNYVLGVKKPNTDIITWANINGVPVFSPDGCIDKVIINFADITVQKNAIEDLQESEERFKALHNASFGGIAIHDKGIILDCNNGLSEMTGYSVEELIGMDGLMLIAERSRKKVMENILSGYQLPYEEYGVRKNGEEYPLRLEARNIPYKGQQVRSVEFRDITIRRRAEEEVHESREWFATTLRSIGDAVITTDTDGRVTLLNHVAESLTGWTLEEAIGEPIEKVFNIVNETSREAIEIPVKTVLKNKTIVGLANHTIIISKNGEEYPIDDSAAPICGTDGVILGVVLIFKDISERKKAENAIQQRIVALTQPLDDPSSVSFMDLYDINEIQEIQDAFAEATGVASIITLPDGTPITKPSNFCTLCKDIIRKTEKGLANCLKSDSAIGRKSDSGPIIQHCMSGGLWDAGASITVGDKHIANWLIGQVRNADLDEDRILNYADEIGADKKEFKNALDSVTMMSTEQFEAVSNSLYLMATQLSTSAYQNVQQARFIAERQKAEAELRSSEEKLRSYFKYAPDGIFVTNALGIYTEVNDAACNITGYYKDELLKLGVLDLVSDESKEEAGKHFAQVSEDGFASGELTFVKKNGRQGSWIVDAVKLNEDTYLGFAKETTQLRRTERELQKMAKLESLGTLAGGLAHNIKNTLANMTFNVGLARMNPQKTSGYLVKVEKSIDQASTLCNRFQTFTSGGDPVTEVISIKDVLEDAISMALSGSPIKEELIIDTNLSNTIADAKQLNEVFTNMLINANDAMPNGGSIKINVSNENIVDSKIGLNLKKYIKIEIEDSGVGMTRAVKDRIFDPFYSTKGKNRGLGLSSCYYIIKKHKGTIEVDSEPGSGTKFTIYLPATDGTIKKKSDVDGGLITGANKRILFVDDEYDLRENFISLGQVMDYAVDTAKDGYEAVGLLKKSLDEEEQYACVILDLTIQGSDMQGEEILAKMKEIQPDVKAIVFSGHSTKPIVAKYRDYGFVGRLEKPVTIEKLSRVINEVCG
jgi:PAS domain S-box-containing protein